MFLDHLLLWVHVAAAIFCVGPVTMATSFTPRFIRSGQLQVVRFLRLTTRVFGLLTILVFASGLGAGREHLERPWLTASMTLFVVAFVLLFAIVQRDQTSAIRALEADAAPAEPAGAAPADGGETAETKPTQRTAPGFHPHVQTGRIAAFSAVIGALWLVILVFMVWRPGG
ncbi:MAG: hypothetical protein J2P24_06665 [Streptosporangiales bacterium]|nr:hypothetical protein [Streptosporangiales bacterium]